MFKFLTVCILSLLASNRAMANVSNVHEITYEWLVNHGNQKGYTDHIPHVKMILDELPRGTLLEFGLGYSTKYLLDRCNKVISVEFVTGSLGHDWLKYTLGLYRDYSNWLPIAYFSAYQGDTSWAPYKFMGFDDVDRASIYQINYKTAYSSFDNFYLIELNTFVINLLRANEIGIALVDPGIFIRGDIVQLLFNKIPIIIGHDTNGRFNKEVDSYAFCRVAPPSNYEEIFFTGGQGTTVWILKDAKHEKLIETLKKHAQGL